jgi:hypothetical protein
VDAASFTEGELESVFSLFSSAALVAGRPERDPNPLNSGTASLSGVAGLSDGVRFGNDSDCTSSLRGVIGLSVGAIFDIESGLTSSLSGVAGLSNGARFANESG